MKITTKLRRDLIDSDFERFSKDWENTSNYNDYLYGYCHREVDNFDYLVKHCDVVTKYNLGYGEKAFRYFWLMVLSQISKKGKFLEIGVFKGSTLSLSQIISKELGLGITSYGLTPLDTTGDKYSTYNASNFEDDIAFLYHSLGLDTKSTIIIPGLSTDPQVKELAKQQGPYDLVYIDGGHDYDTVISDIALSDEILPVGGLLVMDDASSRLNFGDKHPGFLGHSDVGLAIKDVLDSNEKYTHLFACGHNRVWLKNK